MKLQNSSGEYSSHPSSIHPVDPRGPIPEALEASGWFIGCGVMVPTSSRGWSRGWCSVESQILGSKLFRLFFPWVSWWILRKMYHFVVDKIKHFTKWVPKSLTRQLELIPSQWRIVLFRNWHYFTALWLILSVFSSNMSWFQPVDMVFPCFSVDHIKISHLACNVRPRLSWQHWGGEQDFQLCQNGDFCVFFDFVADDTINIPASCMSFFRIFVLGILALLMMNVF